MAKIISFEQKKHERAERRINEAMKKAQSERLGKAFEGLLKSVMQEAKFLGPNQAAVQNPAGVEVKTEGNKVEVIFELNGFLKNELRVRLVNNLLFVDISKPHNVTLEAESIEEIERQMGPVDFQGMSQCIPLPFAVEREGAKASFDNGKLHVTMIRKRTARKTGIQIPIE